MQLALFAFIRTIFNTAYRMAYPFLGVFARALGVDLETMSLALTARSLGGGIIPFIAPLADSRGRKFGMLLGLGAFHPQYGHRCSLPHLSCSFRLDVFRHPC